jgi:hypothetical protein
MFSVVEQGSITSDRPIQPKPVKFLTLSFGFNSELGCASRCEGKAPPFSKETAIGRSPNIFTPITARRSHASQQAAKSITPESQSHDC